MKPFDAPREDRGPSFSDLFVKFGKFTRAKALGNGS